jgi:ribose transport system permease protein
MRRLSFLSYAIGPVLITTGLLVIDVALQPSLMDPANWATTLALASPYIVIGMAQTLPILTGNGGLDLSVGPLAGFCAVLAAGVLVPAGISDPWLLLPMVLGFGLAAGALNGLLVAYLRLPPIIATLGAYLFYAGVASQVMPTPGGEVPDWLTAVVGSYGPVPGVALVLLAVAVVWVLVSRTAYVRNLLAVGCDDRMAYTAGVDVTAVKVCAYAGAGLLCALAGLLLASLLQSADAAVGPPFTISSITAIALGGVSLAGGRGGLLGAALGGASFFLIQHLLTAAGISAFQLGIANGAIMIAALALSAQIDHLRKRQGGISRTAALKPPTEMTEAG